MGKAIAILVGTLAVLLLAVAVFLFVFLDKEKVIELASTTVKEQTGATLTVDGDLSLSFYPVLGVALGDAAVTLPEKTQPDLEIGTARIGVRLAPLLSRRVEVDSIAVENLVARVEAAPDTERIDTSGFSDEQLERYYAARRQARDQAGASAGAAALAVPLALSVSTLDVRNARVESLDTSTGESTVVDIPLLQASDLNLNGAPIPLTLQVQLPGEQTISVEVEGEMAVHQEAERVDFARLEVSVNGATRDTLQLVTSGSVLLARQSADLQLEIAMGEMSGNGTLRYASFESPQIDADLQLNLFDPVLMALAGPEAAQSEAPAASGDEPLPLDALRSIDTRAKLALETARFGEHELTDVKAQLRVVEGVVTLSQLAAQVYGGTVDATAVFNGRHNNASLETQGAVANLDLKAAMANSETPDAISGSASLRWNLQSKGRTANELTAALAGPIKLNTEDITVHGTSVERLLCQVVALTNQEALTATFSPDTQFTEVSADIQLQDGSATLRPLRADLAHVKLTGTGELALLPQEFSATFKARLAPTFEEVDPACRVSKRLTALDFPVSCKGNLSDAPAKWCKVNSDKILRDLAVNEGKRKLEKEAGKLLQKFFGNKDKEAATP